MKKHLIVLALLAYAANAQALSGGFTGLIKQKALPELRQTVAAAKKTSTPVDTPTITPTFSISPTISPTWSISPTHSQTLLPSASASITETRTFTRTPTPSSTMTTSHSATATITHTSTISPTSTHTPPFSATNTPSSSDTPSRTVSPSASSTRTVTTTPSASPSFSPSPSATNTPVCPCLNTYLGAAGITYTAGDGGQATLAGYTYTENIAFDGADNLYLMGQGAYSIRKVDKITGIINRIAGDPPSGGSSLDGVTGLAASLVYAAALRSDSAGNLFYVDNQRVRKITAATGLVSTLAGNDGFTGGFSGDGGLATAAALNYPAGVWPAPNGDVYIADAGSHRIRKIANGTGIITTVAGNGTGAYTGNGLTATVASLNNPVSGAFDSAGNLYIVDQINSAIRKVALGTNVISTVAGNGSSGYTGDGGQATAAQLYFPGSIAFDASDNLYIADSYNHVIRRVDKVSGVITTLTGNGSSGFAGDGGPVATGVFYYPLSIAFDSSGRLYIADKFNHRVRVVTP